MVLPIFTSLVLQVEHAEAMNGWTEYASNPVFDPSDTSVRAYYPWVLYDASKFSGHGASNYYKMWYGTGSTLRLAYSDDGINWNEQGGDLNTLTNPHHPVVVYDASGFGGSVYYKIWYWDSSSPYGNPIRYAESTDGIAWINDQAITQNPTSQLVEGWVSPYWFYASYGPGAVLYDPSGYGSINHGDPMGNKYIMYYDACSMGSAPDGSDEATALAYSADGKYWSRYGSEPVLKAGGGSTWDSGYAYVWTVLEVSGTYKMWYSGGQTDSNDGIGYAESADGITWTKSASPVMLFTDGIAWRSARTYTPRVIYDSSRFSGHGDDAYYKMWYSGVQGSNYAVGYAFIPAPPIPTPVGGEWVPINARQILIQLVGSIAAMSAIAASFVGFKRIRRRQN